MWRMPSAPRLLILVALALAAPSVAKKGGGEGASAAAAGAAGAKSAGAVPSAGAGPYSAFFATLEKTTKNKVLTLMKKMRELAKSPESEREASRKEINKQMQALLGDEKYQKFRALRTANTAKAKAGTTHQTKAPAPAPA